LKQGGGGGGGEEEGRGGAGKAGEVAGKVIKQQPGPSSQAEDILEVEGLSLTAGVGTGAMRTTALAWLGGWI
jgi:hypothetical protein